MKFLTLLFCSLLTAIPTRAEDKWSWVNPLPQGNTLNALAFTDSLTGYAVGDNGAVLKTADGGATWAFQAVGFSHLTAVQFLGKDVGYAVGDKGAVIKTVDAGLHWTTQVAPTFMNLHSLHFLNPSSGYAVGDSGTILTTSNGGGDWKALNGLPMTARLVGVSFPIANVGYAAAEDGRIFKTTDGGSTWSGFKADSLGLRGVRFFTADKGYLAGDTSIYVTLNGGMDWKLILHWDGLGFGATHFENEDTLHVLSRGTAMFTSRDGGANWSRESVDSMSSYAYSIFFINGSKAYAAGAYGYLAVSSDWGGNWIPMERNVCSECNKPQVGFPSGLDFPTADTGYLATQVNLIKTTNGGVSWARVAVFPSNTMRAVHFVDSWNGVACGSLSSDTGIHPTAFIDRSTDGGVSWNRVGAWPEQTILCMVFGSARVGYAMGHDFGLKTEDGGASWTRISTPTGHDIYLLDFIDEETGFASDTRSIFKTTDGGLHWDSLPPYAYPDPNALAITAVRFLDQRHGFHAFSRGGILKTDDGGLSWRPVATPTLRPSIYTIRFLSPTTGYAVGKNGQVLRTTDAGESWSSQDVGVGRPLVDIAFPDTNTGFFSGYGEAKVDSPILLKLERSPGSALARSPTIHAGNLRLGPDGEVRYHLAKRSRVTARVLALDGRVVKTLVDADQESGEHRLVLPSAPFAQGRYLFECRMGSVRQAIPVLRR